MNADLGQQVSHDYLARAADLLEDGYRTAAAILARAAAAERANTTPSLPSWCDCMVCQAVLVAVQLRRHVG